MHTASVSMCTASSEHVITAGLLSKWNHVRVIQARSSAFAGQNWMADFLSEQWELCSLDLDLQLYVKLATFLSVFGYLGLFFPWADTGQTDRKKDRRRSAIHGEAPARKCHTIDTRLCHRLNIHSLHEQHTTSCTSGLLHQSVLIDYSASLSLFVARQRL